MRVRTSATALVLWSISGIAMAGVIDTRPPNATLNYFISTGPDAAGGTFFADADTLVSFSLTLGNGGGGDYRAIVMGADGAGNPSGTVLWESADVAIPMALTETTFFPGLSLIVGDEYFIGFDTGLYTTVVGGDIDMAFSPDVIAGIKSEDLGTGFVLNPARDVTALIVMEQRNVAEPTALALLGLGLAGLALARRTA